jgi:phage virion morphogenesis protein
MDTQITGDEDLRDLFNRLRARAGSLSPFFKAAGELLVDSTKRRFQEGRAPDGTPWAPNTQTTIINYLSRFSSSFSKKTGRLTKAGAGRASGKQPLIGETKSLSRTINYRAAADRLLVGSPMIQAAVQQFGAKKGQFGSSKRGPIPWGDIPARPYLGLSDQDRRDIVALCQEHLRGRS